MWRSDRSETRQERQQVNVRTTSGQWAAARWEFPWWLRECAGFHLECHAARCTTYVIGAKEVATLQGPGLTTSADWILSSIPSSPHPGMDGAAGQHGPQMGTCKLSDGNDGRSGDWLGKSKDILPLCSVFVHLFLSQLPDGLDRSVLFYPAPYPTRRELTNSFMWHFPDHQRQWCAHLEPSAFLLHTAVPR